MENNTRLKKTSPKPSFSILQANELFVKKILSRNSSIEDNNYGISNFKSPAAIPFKWESQPGIPKDLPKPFIEHHRAQSPPLEESGARVVLSSTMRGGSRRLWKLPNKTRVLKKMVVSRNKKVEVAATMVADQNEQSGHHLMNHCNRSSSGVESCSLPPIGSFSDSSSSPTMNASYYNILMRKKVSKFKNMAWGCINGLY